MHNIITPSLYSLTVGISSLIYLQYTAPKVVVKTRKGKRIIKKINYNIPIILMVLTWVSVFLYLRHCTTDDELIPIKDKTFTLKRDNDLDSQKSFRMMRPGVSMPSSVTNHCLPDVFINTIV